MLRVIGLEAAYGTSQVLFGMDFAVAAGEMVTLLGRNGMGKTSTLRAVMGLLKPRAGSIVFAGHELVGKPAFRIARQGLGLVPEGRQIFPNLSVLENLTATAGNRQARAAPWTLDKVLDMFPELEARRFSMGSQLSGGEQQMLAIGRALLTNPRLLILDEATEGLAPLIRKKIWHCLESIKRQGLGLLVVDKNIADLARLADRHYIIEKGRVVWTGSSDELNTGRDVQQRYLGVHGGPIEN